MGHKYFKREGTPGNYKYYYTEAEYRAAKGKKPEHQSSEVIEKDGKKYKLQSNGKYLEVSEHGMTKKDLEREIMYYQKVEENMGNEISDRRKAQDEQDKYHSIASKLSDKEFTKEEIENKEANRESETKGTKTESKLLGNIESKLKSVEKDFQEKIDAIKNYETKLKEHVNKLKDKLPLLEMAAEKYGATISNFNFHKTGNSDVWTEEDKLYVSFNLTPTEKSKIRYIKDKGYDQNGRNKNDSELKAQAEKLENYLKETLSLDSVRVNKYSFREKYGHQGNILVDLWLKEN